MKKVGLFLLSGVLLTGPIAEPARAAHPCADAAKAALEELRGASEATLRKINQYGPKTHWDLETGMAKVDLQFVQDEVIPAYAKAGHPPDQMFLEIEGDRDHLIPVNLKANSAKFPAGKVFRQTDVKVVLKKDGKEIFVSEPGMIEDLAFPRIDPESLQHLPVVSAKLPKSLLKRSGRIRINDPIQLATKLERGIIQVTINPETKNTLLKQRFLSHGARMKFELVRDPKTGNNTWRVTDLTTGERIPVEDQDVWAFANAAFNSNIFKWDGDEVNGALAYNNPEMGMDWINARYEIQKIQADGLQPRENHASNLEPYQRVEKIKLTANGPVSYPNGEFVNPPLTGLAFQDLYRWYPKMGKEMVEKMVQMSRWEREALVRDFGHSGKGHKILGFDWTNLGSGRDNAPRCLGQPGCLALDMISYYKMMLDQEAEMNQYLGNWAQAQSLQAESREIANVINTEYWNPKQGFYTDIVQKGANTTEHSQIRTMTGFWPMMAKATDSPRVDQLITGNLRNPARFGDGPFPPSVSADHQGEVDEHGHPLFDWGGSYWRGGFWPPDGRFLLEGLWTSGRRAEAAQQFDRMMGGIADASVSYQRGDTPSALLNGKPSDAEAQLMGTQGVFWESYGRVPDPKTGKLRPTFNREYTSDGRLHMTRPNLGWSLAFPVRGLKYEVGLDGVPRFLGRDADVAHWVRTLLSDRAYAHHQVGKNPALAPLVNYLQSSKNVTDADLKAFIDQNPAVAQQIARIKNGYLEISPSFDPGINETAIQQIQYNGNYFDLHINRAGANQVQLIIKSDQAIPIQFNRNWTGTGANARPLDVANGSSPIIELGGNSGTPIRLADGSWARAVTISL